MKFIFSTPHSLSSLQCYSIYPIKAITLLDPSAKLYTWERCKGTLKGDDAYFNTTFHKGEHCTCWPTRQCQYCRETAQYKGKTS